MPVQPSVVFVVAFVGLVAACAVAVVLVGGRLEPAQASRWRVRAGLAVLGLLGVSAGLAASGVLRRWDPPPPVLMVFLAVLAGTVALGRSRLGERVASALPWAVLVGFQGFLVLVEGLLHWGASEGFVPTQMTWSGFNFDVVTGVAALALAALIARRGPRPRLTLVWNVLGLALLVNVLVIAVLSMPTAFRQFAAEPANVWVTYPPFVWLPTFIVPLALLGHVLVFRRLAAERRIPAPNPADAPA